ncbi:hypothetical protein, partial [Propionibacterium acidifaciens]|uniref:hypothetical protein n=1 Tax=Propionibacterium acidifaciens TaxID=556499 RepID=UPI0023EFB14E
MWCGGSASTQVPGPPRDSSVAAAEARSCAPDRPTSRPLPLVEPEVRITRRAPSGRRTVRAAAST